MGRLHRWADGVWLVLQDVRWEVGNQLHQWGIQHHPDGTGGQWDASLADYAKVVCGAKAKAGTLTWKDILLEEVYEACAESDRQRLRAELVQVAAVCVSWIEDIDNG